MQIHAITLFSSCMTADKKSGSREANSYSSVPEINFYKLWNADPFLMDYLQTGWMCEHNKARGKEESNEKIWLVFLILKEVTFKIKTNDFITTALANSSPRIHMQNWMVSSSVFVWLLAAVLPNVCVCLDCQGEGDVICFNLICVFEQF